MPTPASGIPRYVGRPIQTVGGHCLLNGVMVSLTEVNR